MACIDDATKRPTNLFGICVQLLVIYWTATVRGFPSCSPNPCRHAAECVTSPAGSANCNCGKLYAGEYCEFNNPCLSYTCLNGGECLVKESVAAVSASCNCSIGYTGASCQDVRADSACYVNPCDNGGTCRLMGSLSSFTCNCPPGFQGSTCAMIDYCASRPCMNGGQCLSGINGNQYRCQCPAGFTGSQCQQDINECSSSTPACLNGGTCINTFGGYSCWCPVSYTGNQCESLYAPCQPNPCLNGASCISVGSTDYRCRCLPGFNGTNCQQNIDDCANNLCANGATCLDGIGTYTCKCSSHWQGLYLVLFKSDML